MLLREVSIDVQGDRETIDDEELYYFLRQTPNHKVLGFAKLQLATYNLSGSDTTRWFNRWVRRIGQPPVIYDSELTDASVRQLHTAMVNRGYMDADVTADTIVRPGGRKVDVVYRIRTGRPHSIASLDYEIEDTVLRRLILADTAASKILTGGLLDRNLLDEERTRITERLRNQGYYAFTKEYINFLADTVAGSYDVALTLRVMPPRGATADMVDTRTQHYRIASVTFLTAPDPRPGTPLDTVRYRDISVVYGPDRYLRPSVLEEKCYIVPGQPYSARAVDRTYEALAQLTILRSINIEMKPGPVIDGEQWLDAVVSLSRNRKQGVSVELDGTNSEGDLGMGVGFTYQHRNLGHGSEQLTAKLRAAYESISGDLEGLINNHYTEIASEVGLTIPKFEFPLLSRRFKKRVRASTEFAVSFNYQERPEYTRLILGAGWKYKWQHRVRDYQLRHTVDLIDVNVVRLPRSTLGFLDEIAPDNPLLRYSYEDHFIMRLGYTFYRTNRRIPTATVNAFAIQPYVSTLRAQAETAGNLLYALSSLVGQKRSEGAYKLFGIQYAQYAKAEVDYTYTRNLNSRNALSFHAGGGIAVPYGNSSMVPFEKRFYAGGANGVRGWGVRTLGPGAYDSRNSVRDFINQCGDIRLDLSVEYRAKLFWVFEGALFIDAGNIWTIRDYATQPGGVFRFNKFYKQIAAAYGAGLRMDFTYFLLRLDLGMKAHNPAANQEPWPLFHPRWGRDANFHFSVGYPF
ncbi:MAG: BamA/TamA family outer membrane protein [Muribaculaceae bacterium]|nr:BamA/TamA family outer membrane protein [Muribaculaceae bacterium]